MSEAATTSWPLISVVMPCYNAEAFVDEAICSALGQTYPQVELVLVDDGSTDGSVDVVHRLQSRFGARLTLLRSERTGPYPARNRGLAAARGEYIAFLDADDYWAPDFLQSAFDAMQGVSADAPVDIAYCGWQNVGVGAPGGQPYLPPAYEDDDPVEHFLRSCPWPIHAALVRRHVIDAVGGFSERMFTSMDYDLWIRLLGTTRSMVRVPRVLAFYRWHGSGQISAVKWRQVMHAWQVRRDFVAAHPAAVSHLSTARRRQLVDAVLLEQGKTLFWRRDLSGAQVLLRRAFRVGGWTVRDLPLLVAAHLPASLFERLVHWADRRSPA